MPSRIPDIENAVTGKELIVDQGESFQITGAFKDGDNNAIIEANIQSFTVTLYDEESASIINSRSNIDVLDASIGVVNLDGSYTLRFTSSDSPIVSSDLTVDDIEKHIIKLVWTWTDGVATQTGISEHRMYVRKIATPN